MKALCSLCGKNKDNVIEYSEPSDSQHSLLIGVPISPSLVCIDCLKEKHKIDVDLAIPKDLDGWNYFKILNFVDSILEENEHLEYLGKAWNLSKEEKLDIERRICSFSNTEGGYILFGIKEKRGAPPLQGLLSLEIVGVDKVPNSDIRIANIIKNTIPSIKLGFSQIEIPTSDKVIIVVKIEKSLDMPVQSSEGIFYIRVQSSSRRMNRDTIRNLFLESDQKVQKRNNLLFELEDIERTCENILVQEKGEWQDFPVITKIDIPSLKNSLSLNYEIFKSKEINEILGNILNFCTDLNENVEELQLKIASGAYKPIPTVSLAQYQEEELKGETFYGSYNAVTFNHAKEILKSINQLRELI